MDQLAVLIRLREAYGLIEAEENPYGQRSMGGVSAQAVMQGIGQVGQVFTDVADATTDSISRFELWRDFIVPLANNLARQYGYAELYDPAILRDWQAGVRNKAPVGGGDEPLGNYKWTGRIKDVASRFETLRAIRILLPLLQVTGNDLRYFEYQLGIPLDIIFPIPDIEKFVK